MSDLLNWQHAIGVWSVDVFGEGQRFLEHCEQLRREVEELETAPSHADLGEELADIMIVAMSLAHRLGFDLREEVARKHSINLKRTWGRPDSKGVIDHERSAR